MLIGRRPFPTRSLVFLVTDGQSNVDSHLTIPNANTLKSSGVEIYVVAIGAYIYGINEIVKVASHPPEEFLFRVKDLDGFWKIIQLAVKQVYPDKWVVVDYDPPC